MRELTFIDLLSIGGLTEAKLRTLLENYKTVGTIFSARHDELVSRHKLEPELARRILTYRPADKADRAIDRITELDVKIITFMEEGYPENLRNIAQLPPVIFVRGELKKSDHRTIGIIGTRKATSYGRAVADRFARDLVEHGITIVSGLARGIDTQAHESALAAGGRTIAVMGTGIDQIYPAENCKLAERIVKNGALITEFNPGTEPLAMNFPKRNRIVSGLSMGIVAVEAKEASGVMNTVNWALNQGREVFAVPGSIFSKYSEGTNSLIRAGAGLVTSAHAVLEELKLIKREKKIEMADLPLSKEESDIFGLLTENPIYLDEIAVRLNQPISNILNVLLTMELKGYVRQLPGKTFVRTYI